MATKKKPDANRGRPPVPIDEDPQRFRVVIWRALYPMGFSSFEAARYALLVEGGPITIEDIEGVLRRASATVPLPPFDPDDPDKGLRRLAAKARRTKPTPWLVHSVAFVQGLIIFIANDNITGFQVARRALLGLGWKEIIAGVEQRVGTALGSNLPPADLERLSPAARRWLAELRQKPRK
jgi:hypothetical protein